MDKEKNYTVYMHINKENNKRYIGITRQNPKKRWDNGEGYKTQPFYNAIKEYGWDGFDHIILFEKLSYDEACKIEKDLIKKYKTNNKNYGYNVSEGGENVIKKYGKSLHTNKKVYQYSFSGCYIRYFNSLVEAVEFLNIENIHGTTNISSCARENGRNSSAYGYIWSYKYLGKKIKEYNLKESYTHNSIKVYQYDLDGNFIKEYNSIKDAANEMKTTGQSISDALDVEHRKSNNYQWRTHFFENGIEPFTKTPNRNINQKKKIVRISLDGKEFVFYDSIKDALEDLGGKKYNSCISDALLHNRKTAYGYRWLYYKEYLENNGKIEKYNEKHTQRNVYVYDINLNFLKEYKNLKELCENSIIDFNIKFSKSQVCDVCNKKKKSYKNYIFTYEKI